MTDPKPDIHRLLQFQELLIKFQTIERQVHAAKRRTWENDTEHSYNLAMTAWFLSQAFSHLDPTKVMQLAMVHDLVEIYAGDTYAYGEQALLDSKHDRETAALERLQQEWPDFSAMTDTIRSYEHKDSEEAKFVYALDKLMPIMHTYLDSGYSWQTGSITLDQLKKVKTSKMQFSSEINSYYAQILELLQQKPELFAAPQS